MDYCPNTDYEVKEMLAAIGVDSIESLFNPIPKGLRAKSFNVPSGISEYEVVTELERLAALNSDSLRVFLGAGKYDHYVPAVVDSLGGRAEFYTAYTPYQPECAQGTLQSLFEYQTGISALTGMDVSNASLYDGGSAVAEAALMAVRITERKTVLAESNINPRYLAVLKTYLENHSIELKIVQGSKDGFNMQALKTVLNQDTACLILQNPNFYGSIEDHTEVAHTLHEAGALMIECVYPVALGLIKTPGEMGADIVIGDGQSLGSSLNFGGPSFGFITTKKQYIRNLPGRIVGETIDKNGKRGFVLTLQAREQHIKRQKATSNICSNQSLCAVRAMIYLSTLGKEGFCTLAQQNYDKAEYAKKTLAAIRGVSIWNSQPTFNEFVLSLPVQAESVVKKLLDKGIAAGLPLKWLLKEGDNLLLVAVTEKRSKIEIDAYAKSLEEALWK